MKAHVRFEHELLAVETDHQVHCLFEVAAPPAPAAALRPPLSLSLVIDRSGSMGGRKLEVTRRCASFLIERLGAADRLSIVDYDSTVRLLAPLVEVGPNREFLLASIGSITPGGQTNLSGGWLKGVETLQGQPDAAGDQPGTIGPQRKVLLLSDGHANVGITGSFELSQLARGTREEHGISTTTVGFGDGFDEGLMTAMADAGNGSAHFAETPDDAPSIFAGEFDDLVSLVAQNVSVEIRPTDRVEVLSVLNDFPSVVVEGGVQLQLGDAYGEERRRVVFQLHVPSLDVMGPTTIADVVLRYVTVGDQVAAHEVRVPLRVKLVSADEAAATGPDAEVTEEVVILMSARAQKRARDLADTGDIDGARAVLEQASDHLRATSAGSQRAAELQDQAEMLKMSSERISTEGWGPMERKRLLFESRSTQDSRRKGSR
jgi:Ca-activated chloride channel family protein